MYKERPDREGGNRKAEPGNHENEKGENNETQEFHKSNRTTPSW